MKPPVPSGPVVYCVITLSVQVYRSQNHNAHLTDGFDLVIPLGCEEWGCECDGDECGLGPKRCLNFTRIPCSRMSSGLKRNLYTQTAKIAW